MKLTEKNHLKQNLPILLGICFWVFGAVTAFQKSTLTGACDLRVRIVGARVAQAGMNPYFFKWNKAYPETLCDPNDNLLRKVNGLTITPFILWLHQPLAYFPYLKIKWIWWVLQQVCFLLTLLLVAKVCNPKSYGLIFVVGAWVSLWPSWQIHLIQGQIYVLYAFWIAVGLGLYNIKSQYAIPCIAAWLAVGCLMRPTLILFGIPFLYLMPIRKWGLAAFLTLAFLAVGFFMSGGPKDWTEYRKALGWYTKEAFNQLPPTGYLAPTLLNPEGADLLTNHLKYPILYFSPVKYYTDQLGWNKLQPIHFSLFLLFILAILVFLTRKKWATFSTIQWLAFASLIYFFSEIAYFYRMAYNQIQWLPMVAAGLLLLAGRVNTPPNLVKKS